MEDENQFPHRDRYLIPLEDPSEAKKLENPSIKKECIFNE
jgi:hypothetical protein